MKTPTSLVIATSDPEKKFISKLIEKSSADMISLIQTFFLKIKDKLVVIEIKAKINTQSII